MKYRNHKAQAKGMNFDVDILIEIIVLDTVWAFKIAKTVEMQDAFSMPILSVSKFSSAFHPAYSPKWPIHLFLDLLLHICNNWLKQDPTLWHKGKQNIPNSE